MDLDYYRTRRTLDEEIEVTGIGIHTNSETSVNIKPVDEAQGIKFIRTDLEEGEIFWPRVDNVKDIPRATVITNGEHDLYTIEHLMASFYALGVTDVTVEVDGPELPALNGSAKGYVEALQEVEFEEINGEREIYRVKEPLYVEDSDQSIVILPSTDLKVSCTISFDNDFIGDQYLSTELNSEVFIDKIAPARTFGFKEEIEDLLDNNLARGGSLDNAIVLNEKGELVGDEPQFPDEFVRHKILDIIGDLSLVESFIAGHIIAVKNSHFLNVALAEKLDRRIDYSPRSIEQKSNLGGDEMLNIDEIKEVLPHRYPFLLVDRILSMDHENQKAVGLKNVTTNEEFFNGHFPGDPIMPGVLIIEAMAQLGAAWILSKARHEDKSIYFMGVDDVKWRQPVRPGDQLIFEIEGKRLRKRSGMMDGRALVNGEKAAEGVFKFALVNP